MPNAQAEKAVPGTPAAASADICFTLPILLAFPSGRSRHIQALFSAPAVGTHPRAFEDIVPAASTAARMRQRVVYKDLIHKWPHFLTESVAACNGSASGSQ